MTTNKPKNTEEITAELAKLPGWELQNQKLVRELKFKSFQEAFSAMTRIALIAEKMDHHPEWFNVYNRLSIALRTHDADGITDKDFQLAQEINGVYEAF